MTDTNRHDHEARLQQLADQGAGADGSAANVYRFLDRAVRAAPVPVVPSDFAAQMEKLTRDFEEQALLETWLLRVLLVIAAAGALAVAWSGAMVAASRYAAQLADAPWSLLLAACIGMTLVWSVDRHLGKPRRVSA